MVKNLLPTIQAILDQPAYTEEQKIYFIAMELWDSNYVRLTEKAEAIKH
jgi:hypothetical protein